MRLQPLTLLLGTNLGDRQANIDRAIFELDSVFGIRRKIAVSQIIETRACGFEGPEFLNITLVYLSARRPENVLRICKKIERSMGRLDAPEYAPDGHRIYHDRIIDIDILQYGNLVIDTPDLKIPHPQLYSRPFVGELLAQLAPKK